MNKIIKESILIKNKYHNIENLIKNYNVKIEYFFNEDLDVKAFTTMVNDNNVIYINDNLDEFESQLILAHELGHIIFHDDTSRTFANIIRKVKRDREEIEANLFAVIFLNLGYIEYPKNKIQKIINYIYCTYLVNNNDYLNYMKYLDYSCID